MRIFIQARMGSTRFPGKVLLGDPPILGHLVKRLKKCVRSSGVTVVTTTETEDDALALYCNDHKIKVVRFNGDPMDVAGRFIFAAGDMEAVVRICADSPFVYPGTVDKAIYLWQHQRPDRPTLPRGEDWTPLVTNIPKAGSSDGRNHPNSGNSVEVVNIKMLKELHPHMTTEEKEHVTPALYNLPGVMRFTSPYGGITVDYPEDLQKYEDRLLTQSVGLEDVV